MCRARAPCHRARPERYYVGPAMGCGRLHVSGRQLSDACRIDGRSPRAQERVPSRNVLVHGRLALCSLAPNVCGLIAFRAVQGLGASMLNPVALSIIANTFQEPARRARAIGIWGAVAGLSLALGPLVGRVLTQSIGWRSIFWINLPIGIAAIWLAAQFVPESKTKRARAVDPVGQALVLGALASLTYAVIEGSHARWNSMLVIGLFVVALLMVVSLLVYEPRRPDPLLDLRFFGSIPFCSAALIAVFTFANFSGFLFLNALYLQQTRSFSAFHTGLCTLPLALMTMFCAPISGRLVGARGTLPSLVLAGIATLVSALFLSRLANDTPLPLLLLAYVIFGVGIGMVNPAITNTAVAGMPREQAGVAAAIASTSRQAGAALGVAVAGTLVAGTSRTYNTSFASATHPVWWIMAGGGAAITLLGLVSNTAWAQASTLRVAHLMTDAVEKSCDSV